MKKIVLLFLLAISAVCHAGSTTVPIIWPFSVGSNQVNFIRAIIDDANKKQDKYNFIVDFKPGASGAVASNYVNNYNGIALISISSSFFVRPYYYPQESHKVENFKPVLIQCTGQPFAVISKRFSNLNELRNQKQLTIGANVGGLTEAVVRQLQQVLPNTELTIVPYPGTMQATQDVLGDRLDLNVDTPGESLQWLELGKINTIGATGTVENKYFKPFTSQGIKEFSDLTNNYMILASSKTDPNTIKELHDILHASAQATTDRLKELYARDYCIGANMNFKQTNDIFNKWSKYWPDKLNSLSKGK